MSDVLRYSLEPRRTAIWIPVLVGLLLYTLSLVFWWTLKENEHADQRRLILVQATQFSADIEADMRSRVPALQRLVNRWEYHKGTSKAEFIHDVENYIKDFPGFQALEWVDRSFHVRWIVPLVGNEKALGLNLGFEENRRVALEKAKLRHAPTMSRPIDLVQGGKGFLVYLPIYFDNNFDGFLIGVFRTRDWIEHIFRVKEKSALFREYVVHVSMDGVPVFEQPGWSGTSETEDEGVVEKMVMDQIFTVKCRPTEMFFKMHRSYVPQVAGTVGAVLSVLIAFVIYLYQKAMDEAWNAHAVRGALEAEAEQRRKDAVELHRLSSRLALATRAGGIGVWEWDIESGRLAWDGQMFDLYDVPPDVLPKYETWCNAVHPDDVVDAENLLQEAVKGNAYFDTEFRIVLSDGSIRHIHASARVDRDADGNPVRMTGVNWDITHRKLTDAALERERWKLASIIRGTNVGTWEWNVQTGETEFNDNWAEIIGYTLDELSPVSIDTWMKFVHPEDAEKSGALLEQHFHGKLDYYECEARMHHRNGEWIWVLDRGKVAVWTDDGKPLLMYGTHQDITEQKRAEAKIRHMATHDALTGLPTLRLARDRVGMAFAAVRRKDLPAAILFVDLDGFKAVNDTCGHDAGDEVLKGTARRLLECVREVDTVARIGGDEFLVVLSELREREDAGRIAEKIIQSVSQPFDVNGEQVTIGASIGISICFGRCGDIDHLIKLADEAMYSVKKSGKNGFIYAEPDVREESD